MEMNCQELCNYLYWGSVEAEIEADVLSKTAEEYNRLLETGKELPDAVKEYWSTRKTDRPHDELIASFLEKQPVNLILESPEKVQEKIEHTLAILLKDSSVKKYKDEYRITKPAPDIKTILKAKIMLGIIDFPEIDGIDDFMSVYLTNKGGKSLADTLRVGNSQKKSKKDEIF